MSLSYNIADLVESLVDAMPDNEALVCGEQRLTFAQLEDRSNRLAHFLRSQGIGAGDHVGLFMHDGLEYVEGMLACMKLRAVHININYRYVAREVAYLFDNADLKGVIVHQSYVAVAREARESVPDLKTVIVVQDGSGVSAEGMDAFDYEAVLAGERGYRDFEPRDGQELYIIYTGGTTGMPKGVMWRHEDLFFSFLQGGAPGGDPVEKPEEVAFNAVEEYFTQNILPVAPFIHGSGQLATWVGMLTGGTTIIVPGPSFQAERIIQLVEEEEVTTLNIVGDAMAIPLVAALKGPCKDVDMDSLMAVASAGAILSGSLQEELQELLPDALILNNFGSSESGHQGSVFQEEGEAPNGGRPTFMMNDQSTVLHPDTYEPCSPGDGVVGRLARSGRIPLGYYKDEEKTAERFRVINGVRYVIPGDFARIEEDGQITLYGRGTMCINTGGEKVYPEEVEEALKAHPSVVDALVVGIPDPKWMQRVTAVVTLVPDADTDAGELDAHARTRVAGYKVPRVWSFTDHIERFASGKPDYTWAKKVSLATAEGSSS
jgi:acyl-CoA synthetase (AMP-forming)/AMP-acid ligase II